LRSNATVSIEEFRYPSSGLSSMNSWEHISSINSATSVAPSSGTAASSDCENTGQSAVERSEIDFELGWKQGFNEGRIAERLEQAGRCEEIDTQRIEEAARLHEQFAREREGFLRSIEPQVVKLAVSIASRILRREAQVDPMLLTGSIRIALGQLADKTAVKMRVPAGDAQLWSETIAHLPNLRIKPEIVADEELGQGECELESDAGSADLGLDSQLREIARSLCNEGDLELAGEPPCGADQAEARA
jgi:flagellar biosynthesis/type III secretory pathway protein FliH